MKPLLRAASLGAAAILVAALASCGSSKAAEKEEMSVALKAGRYQSAYDKAKAVLANPGAHDEATVEYARQVLKDSKTILSEHYSGNISVHIATGNYDRALGIWSDLNEKVPELVDTNAALKAKLMRVYATRELWDKARDMAEAVRSQATSEADRDEAEEFIRNLDEMQKRESELRDLARQVSDLESKTGVDLSGGATCGATSSEALTDDDRQLLVDLERVRAELATVRAALTRPPGSNLRTPVEQAEDSNTES